MINIAFVTLTWPELTVPSNKVQTRAPMSGRRTYLLTSAPVRLTRTPSVGTGQPQSPKRLQTYAVGTFLSHPGNLLHLVPPAPVQRRSGLLPSMVPGKHNGCNPLQTRLLLRYRTFLFCSARPLLERTR
ncbi:unnamed protein product [Ectocarpus sp. 13 AM-2016]